MTGLDTNVLIRYIAQDDPKQSSLATEFVEKECTSATPGFVSLIVLVEVVWVCESCYGAGRGEIARILRGILGSRQLVVERAETAWQALRLFESCNADFSDCLIEKTAQAAGCRRVVTFDKQAARAGMDLLK